MTSWPSASRNCATHSLSVLASRRIRAGARFPNTAVNRSRLVTIRCSVMRSSGESVQQLATTAPSSSHDCSFAIVDEKNTIEGSGRCVSENPSACSHRMCARSCRW
jgi:hypothetical protein